MCLIDPDGGFDQAAELHIIGPLIELNVESIVCGPACTATARQYRGRRMRCRNGLRSGLFGCRPPGRLYRVVTSRLVVLGLVGDESRDERANLTVAAGSRKRKLLLPAGPRFHQRS